MSRNSTKKQRQTLALIAHDEKKEALIDFCVRHKEILDAWDLIGTGTSADEVNEATGLPVEGVLSGPDGGDVQIAAKVAVGEIGAVIFLIDPLSAHPHDPDIETLLRLCNVHNVPIATNLASAELIIQPKGLNEKK